MRVLRRIAGYLAVLVALPAFSARVSGQGAVPAAANPTAPVAAQAAPPQQPPAQDASEQPADEHETALFEPHNKAWLTNRIAQLENMGLDEGEKKAALASYQQALEARAAWKRADVQTRTFRQEVAKREELIAQGKAKLDATPQAPPELPTKLADIEARVLELEQEKQQLVTKRDEAAAKLSAGSARMSEIPKELSDSQAKLRKVEEQIAALPPTPPEDESDVAAIVALVNRRQALQQEIASLQQEQLVVSNRDLLQLEQDLAERELAAKEKLLTQARAERNRLRQAEADRQAQEAARAAKVSRPEPVAKLADRNAELAADRKKLQADLAALSEVKDKRQARKIALQKEFENTKTRIKASGLSVSAGRLLLRQQKDLPHVRELRLQADERINADADLQFKLYELQDERNALADVEARVAQVATAAGDLPVDEAEVRRLLEDQRKYLDDLIADYRSYTLALNQVAADEDALATLAEEYGEYIGERVLWVRNAIGLGPKELPLAADAARWSLDPDNWRDAGEEIGRSFRRRAAVSAVAALAILGLMAVQRRARRNLRDAGIVAAKRTCAEFKPTLRALVHTVIIALPWPALLWFLAWSMDARGSESDFVRSLSGATKIVAACLLLLELLRALCRGAGLAEAHFEWPAACLAQIRRHARWLTAAGLPLVLWTAGLELQETEPLYSTSLGRICFIALMLLLAYVLERMLLGRKSPFRQLISGRGGWLAPLEHVWRPVAVLMPVALAVLAATGYYFSAQQAAVQLVQSFVLMLGVLVASGLTWRLILTNRRSLAREQAKQRRAQLAAAAAAQPTGEVEPAMASAELPTADLVEETVDLAALSEQTEKLVRTCLALATVTGLFLIWRELLPAVVYKFEQPLLPGFELTWAEMLKCLVVLAITYIAVRDIPALMELAILQRLPLDSGSRYALSTITRYVLAGIGIVMAYKSLGYTGENIQWLVAAMGVGLGFGLQEIFANFVSGIILLFERPIRVGDVVTLGEKTGAVSRIRMRATTIVDWDRKEYIVPNKDLVTERLLNWTLTDQTNRIMINVGVAYGNDTELACRLLVEAAREQPAILDDPPPVATFEGFGDSSLNLALRAYLPSLENRLATIHALHTTIDRKFREGGLEIPFPQRDLNLRNIPAEWLEAVQRTAARRGSTGENGSGSNGHGAEGQKPAEKPTPRS